MSVEKREDGKDGGKRTDTPFLLALIFIINKLIIHCSKLDNIKI